MENSKILISFSGGRTSAFMCRLIQESSLYKDFEKLFVYANTGKEKEETLTFVNQCDKEFKLNLIWVEADIIEGKGNGTKFRIVDFNTASRNGEPFEALIKKYGLPSKYYRHCTRDLKEIPIHKYTKSIFGKDYVTAVGIRADEKHRLGSNPKLIYPLAEIGIDELTIRMFWDQQTFDLELKDYQGNCDLCFLKSQRKQMTLIDEGLDVSWWNEQEIKHGTEKQSKFNAHRKLLIKDLVELAKQPFNKAVDKHDLRKQQRSFDFDLDTEFDCFCKMN